MRSQKTSLALLVVALSLLQLTFADSGLIKSSFESTKLQNEIRVPDDMLSKVKSYAIYGWVRPSQTMDTTFTSQNQRDKYSLIMGSTTSKTGWGNNNVNNDSFLAFSITKWKEGCGFILGFENKKAFDYLYANMDYHNFFGRWYFLYGAHHESKKFIYFAAYLSAEQRWLESKVEGVERIPIKGLYTFSVNTADSKKNWQFNGYVFDSGLTYNPDAAYYSSTAALDTYLAGRNKPTFIGVKEWKSFTVIGKEQSIPDGGLYQSLPDYQGAEEYSINGQAQFTGTFNTGGNTILFRVLTNNPETSSLKSEGDTTLFAYVEKGKKTCFSTYIIQQTSTSVDNKICFDVVPDKNWIYFYQGYSREKRRVFSYVRINNQNYYQVTEDVLHVDPNSFYVFIGKDKQTMSNKWQGLYKSVTLEYGPGAYRETLINSLPVVEPVDVKKQVTIPETYKPATVIPSDPNQTISLDVQVVEQKYIEVVKEFAIHFWIRRSLTTPVLANFEKAKEQQAVAGVTEREDYTSTQTKGDQALSILYQSHNQSDKPGYIFSSYSDNESDTQAKQYIFEYDRKFDQGQWHWVYFAYNKEKKQASLSVTLPNGEKFQTVINGVQHSVTQNLKAILGESGDQLKAVGGEFFDYQFVYYNGCYQNTQAGVDAYVQKYVKTPPNRLPEQAIYKFLDRDYFYDKNRFNSPALVLESQAAGALNYSIVGWAKWSVFAKKFDSNLLFSLSLYKTKDENRRLGDLVLEIHLEYLNVVFMTYRYDHKKDKDTQVEIQKIELPKEAEFSWCYYYMGYSFLDQLVIGSVSCKSGFQGQVKFGNVQHIVPSTFSYIIAKNENNAEWNGQFYKPYIVIGYPVDVDYNYNTRYYDPNPEKEEIPDKKDQKIVDEEKKKEEEEEKKKKEEEDKKKKEEEDKKKKEEEDKKKKEEEDKKKKEEEEKKKKEEEDKKKKEDEEKKKQEEEEKKKKEDEEKKKKEEEEKKKKEDEEKKKKEDEEKKKKDDEEKKKKDEEDKKKKEEDDKKKADEEKKSKCATIYSQCGYNGKIQDICENIPKLNLREIKSIYIPKNKILKFFDQENYNGLNVKFVQSVECLEIGLQKDKNLKWNKIEALFNSGFIKFINKDGDEISKEEAYKSFFGKEAVKKIKSQKSMKHLKKVQDQINPQDEAENPLTNLIDNDAVPTQQEQPHEKSFWEKLMFWRD